MMCDEGCQDARMCGRVKVGCVMYGCVDEWIRGVCCAICDGWWEMGGV